MKKNNFYLKSGGDMADKRFDRRTKDQFKKDIRKSTKEQSAILRSWLFSSNQQHLIAWDHGVDNSGEFINSANNVTCDPDYEIEKYGLVEVQYSNPMCIKYFHIKKNKLLTCVVQDANILMVNGWSSDHPKYTLLTPGQCKVILARFELVNWYGGGSKAAYRVPTHFFEWKELKKCQ